MLGAKLFGSGLNTLATNAMVNDGQTALVAAGTTQATALELTNAVNVLGTVASGAGVKLLALSSPYDSMLVFNGGANVLKVYPDLGSKINNLATNAGINLQTNTACEFTRVSTTQWIAVLSA